eukprot:462104_1
MTNPKKDLIISFSVSNNQYFGIYFSIDNGGNNKKYPRDNPLAIGDIKSIVDANSLYTSTTRQKKASNDTNFKGHGMQPNVKTIGNAWPLIIKIQNN